MSTPPPGYETPQASPPPPPPAPQGGPPSHENAGYEFKSVQALRGRESSAKARWQDQGWELISENRGTLRTELRFRRVKPKTVGAYLLSSVAALRRLQPRTLVAVVASGALLLVAGSIGIVAVTQGGAATSKPSAVQTTASTAPPAGTAVTDTTVDDLVDMLNSAGMGGMKVGDQFKVTGELVGSQYWSIGASGDFFVMLETTVGSDLEVFIDESAASGWQDGTKVEMVLKMVEATIDGETTDGWFEVQSAKTVSQGTA